MTDIYGRGKYRIIKSGSVSPTYTLMCDGDKLAIIVPLVDTVYGPDTVGLLFHSMVELINDAATSDNHK